ncbi:hypothetical protein ACQCVC_05265 [Bacillus altitudinis]
MERTKIEIPKNLNRKRVKNGESSKPVAMMIDPMQIPKNASK